MSDIANFLTGLAKYSESMNRNAYSNGGNSKAGSILNLSTTRTLGTALVRIISDANRVPVRLVHGVYEIWFRVPAVDDKGVPVMKDGKQVIRNEYRYVVDPANYHQVQLTPDQRDLLDRTINLLEEVKEYVDEEYEEFLEQVGISRRTEVTMFYGKLLNLVHPKEGSVDKGDVRIFRHHSNGFYKAFSSAATKKTDMRGSASWMNEYFNRNAGKHNEIISIDTTRPNVAYEIAIQFDQGQDYELTESDVAIAKNIYAEIWDVTKFDTDYVKNIYDRLRKMMDDYLATQRVASGMQVIPGAQEAPPVQYSTQPTQSNPPTVPQSPANQVPGPTVAPPVAQAPTAAVPPPSPPSVL